MAKKRVTPADPEGKGYLKHIAYDSVVFGFNGEQLKILLLHYHSTDFFALPGGFVEISENLDDAVKRGLKERTGIDNIFLEQFYAFGSIERFNPAILKKILQVNGQAPTNKHWLLDRFISVAYYALINYNHVSPKPDALADSCKWYDVNKLPALILDHKKIVEKALQTLRANLDRKIIGMNLLPARFTMKELQHVYEAIRGEKISRSSFQRDMLNLGILKRHEKHYSGGSHKAPYIYSFK